MNWMGQQLMIDRAATEELMLEGAKNALRVVLALNEGESLLIVTDQHKRDIASAFARAGSELGAEVRMVTLPEALRPLTEVPAEFELESEHCEGGGVIINAIEAYSTETPFRLRLLKQELGTNSRIGHAPGITVSMMTQGPMTVDYAQVARTADHLMAKFENASTVHLTAPAGTDITLGIAHRPFDTDVRIKPGTYGNLPAGEIWCAPIEHKADGLIVCDGSIGDLGQVSSPLKITVKGGKIVALQSTDNQLVDKIRQLTSLDDMASVIGELGIGLNPRARLTGNLLEDEKAGQTAHIAFGHNTDMPHGQNHSKTHRDFLFYNPTLQVQYLDGSKKTIIKDGDIVA
jgi:leucyl aminopeptidase (aminopeptidase T)